MMVRKNIFRWISIVVSFAIVSLILWNTYTFFQNFKEEERVKMTIWAKAYDDVNNNSDLNASINDMSLAVLQSNTTTPMILVNSDGIYSLQNMPGILPTDSIQITNLIALYKNENTPIEMHYEGELIQTIYYGNSSWINKLKYYPIALLLILILFSGVVYFFYKASKNAAQNKLWTGMAKETAHQIGTPLSSLIGWLELLKASELPESTIQEMGKDISRLQMITDRFSKIGSKPTLKKLDVVTETAKNIAYLESRTSRLIQFSYELPKQPIFTLLSAQLYSWTIENLVKNAIDAMKGKGMLKITIHEDKGLVFIQIHDTGKGLQKSKFSKIFTPGYTTKKRGWGLGLSLSKRIIEDYHNGKIKVVSSVKNKGTIMQVQLKTITAL